MKGIVFTEFLELVEEKFGLPTVQRIIDGCDLKTEGVYTSVGTYDHKEMGLMISKLSEIEGIPVENILQDYGQFFFTVLSQSYPQFMGDHDLFSFFKTIDNYIHPEVLKLYPDAELPRFDAKVISTNELILVYQSSRKMADFAVGLIYGAGDYFGEKLRVEKMQILDNGSRVDLKIIKLDS